MVSPGMILQVVKGGMTIIYIASFVDGTSDDACLSRGRFEPGVGHEPSLATWTTIDKTFGFNPATKKKLLGIPKR